MQFWKDINECLSNPCQFANATCVNGLNSYTCLCPRYRTGLHCETGKFSYWKIQVQHNKTIYITSALYVLDIGICSKFNNPCKNGATCAAISKTNGTYNCVCPPSLTGQHCESGNTK